MQRPELLAVGIYYLHLKDWFREIASDSSYLLHIPDSAALPAAAATNGGLQP